VRELTIYEADLVLLLRGESVTLDRDVAVILSALLSPEYVAALLVTELMDRDKRRARDAAVLPETVRRLM
jgi:hypothetical protein